MEHHKLSERIEQMAPSQTIAMSVKAREMRAQGIDVINLSIGEPDFNTPEFIKKAAIEAINEDYNSYTPIGGYLELKEAVCHKFKRDNALDYTTDEIVVSTGSKQSIFNALQVLVNPGDEVILPAPYWVSYVEMVKLAGGIPVTLKTKRENHYKLTVEELKAAITPRTKAILYSNPNNPSGSVLSRKELEAIAEVVLQHEELYVISDEIYEHLNYGQEIFSIAAVPGMKERTVTTNGLAKAYAMTGWRIGFIGAPNWIAKGCEKLQSQVTSGTNCIAQRAAITALRADLHEIQYMMDAFAERRKLIFTLAQNTPGFATDTPEGAFYVFPDVSAFFGKTKGGKVIETATDFSMFLLETANVATVTGDAFGAPNNIRLSYAASEENIKEAFRRINKAIQE